MFNSALHPPGVAKLSTGLGWGKRRNVTFAGLQVTTLCDPIMAREFLYSGEASCKLLYSVPLLTLPVPVKLYLHCSLLMSVELVNRIYAFFDVFAAFWLSLVSRMTVAKLVNKSDHDLFCKLCAPTHALKPFRNGVSLRTRGHSYHCRNILLIFIRNLFLSVVYIA